MSADGTRARRAEILARARTVVVKVGSAVLASERGLEARSVDTNALKVQLHDLIEGGNIAQAVLICQSTPGPIASVLADVKQLMKDVDAPDALRFTAAMTDGANVYAFRWACDAKAPSLYWRRDGTDDLVIVSEPYDEDRNHWNPIPQGAVLVAREGEPVQILPLDVSGRIAA